MFPCKATQNLPVSSHKIIPQIILQNISLNPEKTIQSMVRVFSSLWTCVSSLVFYVDFALYILIGTSIDGLVQHLFFFTFFLWWCWTNQSIMNAFDSQFLERVLEESSDDLDSAIKRLNELHLSRTTIASDVTQNINAQFSFQGFSIFWQPY